MKQLTIIILLSTTFFMGNAQGLHQQVPASEKLVLNNGAKWKVDQPTSNNVIHLRQIVKVANAKTLSDYHRTGIVLQAGINKMIKECRIKGPNHLALHKWLEPLMEQVVQINRSTSEAYAKKYLDKIKDHLNIFDRYFQE